MRSPIDGLGKRLLATVRVGGEPEWIGAGFDSVWVTNRALGTVQRVDPSSNEVIATVALAEPCNGFAFGFGAVWTASCADQAVIRIDPTDNKVQMRVKTPIAGDGEGQLASGFNSIWVSGGDGRLRRINPMSGRIVGVVTTPMGADAVVAGTDAIWITNPDGNESLKIDPRTDQIVGHVPVGRHPQFLTAGPTAVWVLNQDDGTVSEIGAIGRATRTIPTASAGRDVGCISAGLDAAWVTVPQLPLTRIDARSGTVTEQFSGAGGDCLTTGFGAVWLVNNALGTVSRIAPPAQ